MLVDCMFSQPYWSFIEFQNGCIDNPNPNSVTASTVNQFEAPVRVDMSTRRFSLSFISVVNRSMTFLYFPSTDFFTSVLSFFRLSLILSYAVSSDVILMEFITSVSAVLRCSAWNIGIANPPYLVGRKISTLSLSLHMWHTVTAGINLFQIVLSGGSSIWRVFGMVLRKQLSLLLNPLVNAK